MKKSKSNVVFINSDYRYGFHISKSPTLTATVKRVVKEMPYSNFQTYLGNPRSHSVANCDIDDILSAREELRLNDLTMFIHGCLMYNLCGAPNHRKDPKYDNNIKNTCDGLVVELDIAAGMGCSGVVVHPNSCKDVQKGIFTSSTVIQEVLTRDTVNCAKLSSRLGITRQEFKSRRKILLENSAHEGDKRGWNLEELGQMIKGVPEHLRCQVGVCIDTAHAYGAGIYDFGEFFGGYESSDIKKFYDDFEKEIGLEYLKLFHLNDSMRSTKKASNAFYGSHKDRHQNLGLGYIFGGSVAYLDAYLQDGGKIMWDCNRKAALREFFLQARKRKIPIVGEPTSSTFGGRYDWGTVCDILKDTEYPLEIPLSKR